MGFISEEAILSRKHSMEVEAEWREEEHEEEHKENIGMVSTIDREYFPIEQGPVLTFMSRTGVPSTKSHARRYMVRVRLSTLSIRARVTPTGLGRCCNYSSLAS